jgi:hypothetical protein
MLTEIAITPQFFDEESNSSGPQWREHLRQLGWRMFPSDPDAPSSLVISDLYSGSWSTEAGKVIKQIKDENTRHLAEKLWQMMRKALVMRSALSGDWPGDEEDSWVSEAIEAAKDSPIARILVTSGACRKLSDRSKLLRDLSHALEEGVPQSSPVRCPRPVISEQIELLRPFCFHGDFLAFISPYIKGAGDDETNFAIELMKQAANCPNPDSVMFDIHTESPDGQSAIDNRCANIRAKILRHCRALGRVRLFLWPKLLERHLIAGESEASGGSRRERKARWVISLTHPARRFDSVAGDRATFSLLPRNAGDQIFRRFYWEAARSSLCKEVWPITETR